MDDEYCESQGVCFDRGSINCKKCKKYGRRTYKGIVTVYILAKDEAEARKGIAKKIKKTDDYFHFWEDDGIQAELNNVSKETSSKEEE